jgi:hypothetical protein
MNLLERLRETPPPPCFSGYCTTVKIKACRKSHKKGCFAFQEYLDSKHGEFTIDNVGRMRKGIY